ncbi:pro-resilin-like [Ochlerotatus camptorhynchus]|uniref:pro-resilin-like n=1 Tax=Ochlerotatus camptorhynchus TaxID=644619 RepID=UPI0031DE4AFF
MFKFASVLLVLAIATSLAAPQSHLPNGDQSQEWGLARQNDRKNPLDENGSEQNQESPKDSQEAQKGGEEQQDRDDGIVLPNYEFAYGVYDPITGDHKDQWEKRVGDHVKGVYMLDQPDGKKRVVEYEGDSKRGIEQIVTEVDRPDDSGIREPMNGIAF